MTQAKKDAETEAKAKAEADAKAKKDAEDKAASKSSATVYVYCKLPAGISFPLPAGNVLTLAGANTAKVIGGYGRTSVAADAWDYVEKQYGTMPVFTNKIVFRADTAKKGDDQAKEQKRVRTGFEGVNAASPGMGVNKFTEDV